MLGANVRAVREAHGLTLDELARAARPYGARWSTGRVAVIEGGGGAVTVETLAVLSLALSAAAGRPVTTGDLLGGDGAVELGHGVELPAGVLLEVLAGRRWSVGEGELVRRPPADVLGDVGEGVDEEVAAAAWQEWAQADARAARRLGMTPGAFLGACVRAWGRVLSAEVEARLEPGAAPARRAWATRRALEELAAHAKE